MTAKLATMTTTKASVSKNDHFPRHLEGGSFGTFSICSIVGKFETRSDPCEGPKLNCELLKLAKGFFFRVKKKLKKIF